MLDKSAASFVLLLAACSSGGGLDAGPQTGDSADVEAVTVRGDPGAYTFEVTVASPDTGCDRYADWWEIVADDGRLVYRRILLHSHVDEQPFTRSGGPANVSADDRVWVRAHLNTGGYGIARVGTAASTFEVQTPPAEFADGVETEAPQPDGCAF